MAGVGLGVGAERGWIWAKEARRAAIARGGVRGRRCVRMSCVGVLGEEGGGEARTCWIFLEPASWVRMLGHFMARERSRWYRESQAVGVG